MKSKYIIALDQGTTSSRALIFNHNQELVAISQKEIRQIYPKEGWVEHDPVEIWASTYGMLQEILAKTGLTFKDIAAIGITNQRETTILWEKSTGKPVYNAIVWQCRRTADYCERLKEMGLVQYIRENTGLVVDAYFSATKIKWILDNVAGAREKAEKGELLFGTVDSWLLWKLTEGKVHATDYTNASRTMLYNIKRLEWDSELLNALDIPPSILPEVRNSSEILGYTDLGDKDNVKIPIAGIAGDQQAALFGQACFYKGMAKNTYGTGCFLLMHIGDSFTVNKHGLLTTIAIGINSRVEYAFEGSVFVGGAAVKWLRDELHFIYESNDTEYFAEKVKDNGGVYVVPAFVGLGAPHWDMYARGSIFGLTRGSGRNHIIRATLESIAYSTRDVLDTMLADLPARIETLKVDGGVAANNFLMQFQADIISKTVERPVVTETTALGAAYLAGLGVGYWGSREEIAKNRQIDRRFTPVMPEEERKKLYHGWNKAVERSKNWADDL